MATDRKIRAIFNNTPNTTSLGINSPEEINKLSPKAQILFIQTDTNEVEISLHFDPPVKPTHETVPASHQFAAEMYSVFMQLASSGLLGDVISKLNNPDGPEDPLK